MGTIETTALILWVTDYSETSQVFRALSPEHGLVSAIAKGAYRPKQKLLVPVDRLTLCRFYAYEGRAEGLAVAKETDLLQTFLPARRALPHWYAALCVADVAQSIAQPKNADPALFAAALRAMGQLCGEADPRVVLLDFFARVLHALGLTPDVSACAASGKPLGPSDAVRWEMSEGLVYAARHAPRDRPTVPMAATTFAVARHFLAGVESPLQRVTLGDSLFRRLGGFSMALLVHALQRKPRSFDHLAW